jgi:hypothetical protein
MFVFLERDSFDKAFRARSAAFKLGQNLGDQGLEVSRQAETAIRRPYRGVQIKEDTYATLSVRGPSGKAIPLLSSSALIDPNSLTVGYTNEYADFILQRVDDQRVEKSQVIETFGESFVYFFGERPRITNISGMLMNTEDFNWRSQFWSNYDKFFRGSKLVEMGARLYLTFDTQIIEGYALSASATDDSSLPYAIPFQMSVFMTNQYDWSSIGRTVFPARNPDTLDVLNARLAEERNKYVSTTAEVRDLNLRAGSSGGLLATVRGGIRKFNEITTAIGNTLDAIGGVLGGRTVRVPLGIASFIDQASTTAIASGSVSLFGSEVLPLAIQDQSNIINPLKLTVPGYSKYAPSWVSPHTGSPIGYINENVDEYPKREESIKALADLTTLTQAEEIAARQEARKVLITERKAQLIKQNLLAEAGGYLGTLADLVTVGKSAFGMAMTGLAFARDPAGVARAAIGLPQEPASLTDRQSAQKAQQEKFAKMGVKSSQASSNLQDAPRYVGASVSSFKTVDSQFSADVQALFSSGDTTTGPAQVGQVYNTSPYTAPAVGDRLLSDDPRRENLQTSIQDKDYESVYGNKDFTALLAVDPEAKQSLDEVFGNNDAASQGSDVDPASFNAVFGAGAALSTKATSLEASARLQKVNSLTRVEDDVDTRGIRGEADDDAEIRPVI